MSLSRWDFTCENAGVVGEWHVVPWGPCSGWLQECRGEGLGQRCWHALSTTCRGAVGPLRCCRMDHPEQKARVCLFIPPWLSKSPAPLTRVSGWTCGDNDCKHLCSSIGAARCQGLGWLQPWHHRLVFCPSRPASPQAERSALHLVGPQYSLVELKWVLHARSLYPGTWEGAHHKGLSMEPLTALNWSLAHRPPAPQHLRHWRSGSPHPFPVSTSVLSLVQRTELGRGQGASTEVWYNFPNKPPLSVCVTLLAQEGPSICGCGSVFSRQLWVSFIYVFLWWASVACGGMKSILGL